MKLKIIQGTDLQKLEIILNNFLTTIKFESIDLKVIDNKYIFIVMYFDKI